MNILQVQKNYYLIKVEHVRLSLHILHSVKRLKKNKKIDKQEKKKLKV